ncbi:universal stress protein [Agrobacterium rosae]|uniref:Universal stress protein n=1 Tax=Agrobacterium rosae TaxID=1972867 RepID=A0AAE5RZD0_9HYPH|nr:universal stress protein [Agrobacterium rosae]KAA3512118.1 universal stress protein [Agrobacterium rosae]KAA3520434.1 universal stress protein [Agrobacterium rosae]MCM2432331.1 universal stress protein [Agrobacterium rosae]MDX8331304.1 universal stress protein [Agrobacterium rosae]MQB48715.1 universal stress protein [Agrobacterium rosae]
MGYKTILAVMDTAENARKLGDFTASLANTFSSHVIGLHMESFATVPLVAPMEMPDPATVQAVQEVAHQETTDVGLIFNEKMAAENISNEWRSFVSSVGYSSNTAIQSARSADIIIARQTTSSPLSDSSADIDNFLYESGRPVLLVPHVLDQPKPIKRVLVAWNGSREATRATFDALPFLIAAESVEIFSVGAADDETQSGALAGSEIASTLARHGINVTVTSQEKGHGVSAEKAIEKRLSDNSIDLLVMGAYGHSRWWEMLFGGVTRTLLDKMTALTLLSR